MTKVVRTEELLDFLGEKFLKEKDIYEKSGAVFVWEFDSFLEKEIGGMENGLAKRGIKSEASIGTSS